MSERARTHGHEDINPKLPDDDFVKAVRIRDCAPASDANASCLGMKQERSSFIRVSSGGASGGDTVVCHCLLLEKRKHLALVDTGLGLQDVRNPVARLGQPLIDMAGTAVRRIEALGFGPDDVRHIILTHGDSDHAGGHAAGAAQVTHKKPNLPWSSRKASRTTICWQPGSSVR